jgi:hypothetical protein
MPHVHAFCSVLRIHASADVLCPSLPALLCSLSCSALYTLHHLIYAFSFIPLYTMCLLLLASCKLWVCAMQQCMDCAHRAVHSGSCGQLREHACSFEWPRCAYHNCVQRQLSHLLSTMPEPQGVPGCLSAAQHSQYQQVVPHYLLAGTNCNSKVLQAG